MKKRLRVLDINTPWFWLTAFYYGPRYGAPSFELSVWPPHVWDQYSFLRRWWIHVWVRESIPSEEGEYARI